MNNFLNYLPNIGMDLRWCLVGFDDMAFGTDMLCEFEIPCADALLIGFCFFVEAIFPVAATMAARAGKCGRAIDDDICVRFVLFQNMLAALPKKFLQICILVAAYLHGEGR